MTKITIDRATVQQALEALEYGCKPIKERVVAQEAAITALRTALEQPDQEPVGWLDGTDKLAEFMHRDLKADHDRRGSATPREFTIPVYLAPPAAQPEHGDIRALKYRIHELEGEVIGYKRIIEEAALKKLADLGQEIEQEPVALWQKRHPLRTGGAWENTSEYDAKWWSKKAQGWDIRALYTTPPAAQRPWVGLTDAEIKAIAFDTRYGGLVETTRAIEAKLKEKNAT